jgi:hypothetical protein
MLSCKEVSMLLSQAQERPLGRAERLSMHLHLLICAGCRNVRAQLGFLRAAVRRYRDGDDAR